MNNSYSVGESTYYAAFPVWVAYSVVWVFISLPWLIGALVIPF